MKLTAIILLTACLQVSASGFTQSLTLKFSDAPLSKVLTEIEKKTNYSFIYGKGLMEKSSPVNINVTSTPVEKVLELIFKSQPLEYKISDEHIIISLKATEGLNRRLDEQGFSPALPPPITGVVRDADGNPLSGVNIVVKGTKRGTTSNADGSFSIEAKKGDVLVISSIGYAEKQMTVGNDMMGTISLAISESKLDEVQIIAYGKSTPRFNTSNIGSISGDVISRQPVTNPLVALQGRIPGLFIQQTNGLNTGAVNVTIQGKNSLFNTSTPFYVVDGVPFTPNAIGGSNVPGGVNVLGTIGTGDINNLNFLNPNEIESITVLKDADATAIYGSRAANGAILITTKKGKSGRTKVDLNLQNGWGKVANKLKVLNTEQYIALKKEMYANDNNQPIPATAVDINETWDENRNVDWQKELSGETAQYQNLQASLSGGSERTQFLAGVGYIKETPVFKGDFSNVKTSVKFNINHASSDQKFKFSLSGSYLDGNNKLPVDDITARAITLAPNFPDLYNGDGTVNWAPVPGVWPFQATTDHPAANLLKRYTNKATNLISSSDISYEVTPGLVIRSTFGYNSLTNRELATRPFGAITPQNKNAGIKPFANFGDRSIKSWIIEPQVTFTKAFSFGILDALIGSTFQSAENFSLILRGTNYTNDAQLEDYNAAGTKSTLGSYQSKYNYSAVFGRLNYRLKDKYILNLAARRDGSSRFGAENLFHSFYSAGGAWIFSEEGFLKGSAPFFNYGKLRASYGSTGNDQIGDYLFYSLYSTPFGIGNNYLGIPALVPEGLPNPYLQWEQTKKLNFGLDLGFFDSKVLLSTNFFRNRSSNQLLSQNLSAVTGFTFITRNLPALVQNTGWEFSFQYNPVKSSAFDWQGAFNITIPKNKLLRYDELEKSNDRNKYVIGQSISLLKLYSFQGVNPETGLYQFKTAKGEVTSAPSDPDDKIVFITTDPKWYGGLSNTFNYKGFSLDLFFNFVSQMATNLKFSQFPYSQFNTNYLVHVLDHWKKPGDHASIQRISANPDELTGPFNAASESDGAYNKITYARLNNAILSYTFSNNIAKRIHLSNARVYVQGQNLFTICNYSNGDPEVQSIRNLGLLRMYTVGMQLTF